MGITVGGAELASTAPMQFRVTRLNAQPLLAAHPTPRDFLPAGVPGQVWLAPLPLTTPGTVFTMTVHAPG